MGHETHRHKPPVPLDVDTHLAERPAEQREVLEKIRNAIRAAAPEAEETIRYGIPTYLLHGPLVHLAAFRDHSSFIVASRQVVERFEDELQHNRVSGMTIRLPPHRGLPASPVEKIVRCVIPGEPALALVNPDEYRDEMKGT